MQMLTPQQRYLRQPMGEEEQSSGLARLGQGALTGLSYLGNWIDTPGSVVRGLVTGRPDRALEGIFDWSKRVRGSDITGNDPNASLFSLQGLGNIGTEIALDPLNLITAGGAALSKLGKASKAAGVTLKGGTARAAGLVAGSDELAKAAKYLASTPESVTGIAGHYGRPVADVARDITGKSLGGNIGLSALPFGFGPQITADASPVMNAIGGAISKIPVAGPALGAAGRTASATGRLLGAGFNKAFKGKTTEIGQGIAAAQSAEEAAARAAGLGKFHDVMGAAPGVPPQGLLDPAAGVEMRRMVEGFDPMAGPLAGASQRTAQELAGNLAQRQQYRDLGALKDPSLALGKDAGYMFRQAAEDYAKPGFMRPSLAPEKEIIRKEMMKIGVPTQGKDSINQFLSEPLAGRAPDVLADHLRNNYIKWTPTHDAEMATLRGLGAAAMTVVQKTRLDTLESLWKRADQLAEFKTSLGDIKYEFFDKHFLSDLAAKFQKDSVGLMQDRKLHEGLLGAGMARAAAGPDAVSLAQTLKDSGLFTGASKLQAGANSLPMQRTVELLSKKLGNPNLTPQQALAELGNLFVPKSAYDDITRATKLTTSPGWLKPILDVVDSATNLFRGAIRTWPSYLSRNFASAAAHNVIYKGFDPSADVAMRYIKPMLDANSWRAGKLIDNANQIPAFAHMTPQQASDELSKAIIQWDIPGRGQLQNTANLPQAEALRELIPGLARPGLKEAKEALTKAPWSDYGQAFNPKKGFGVKGVGNNKTNVNPIVNAADKVSTLSDEMNRVSLFIAKMRQGLSPEAARAEVLRAHYDFSNLTSFESGVMRRLMPFYAWARQSVPQLIKDVLQEPGGRMATLLKVGGKARGDSSKFLPQQLNDKIAIPLGDEKDGTQRYLSSLGLPIEELGQAMDPTRYLLGQLNPYIKGPLENATNRQFHSGREMADLGSRTGAPPALENLLLNSPLSRILGAFSPVGGTLFDPRKGPVAKGVGLLTGAKIADVDMDKTKSFAARDVLENLLRGSGGRVSENFSIPPEVLATLSPADLQRYRLYVSLRRDARTAAQRRERAAGRP